MNVVDIANEIWQELGSPETPSIPSISSWLRFNIGQLNVLIGLCVTFDTNIEFTPELSEEEKSILKKLYSVNYYNDLVRQVLSAGGYVNSGSAGTSWISLEEGDSRITRVNPNEVAKTYRGILADQRNELNQLVSLYKFNKPSLQVAGDDTIGVYPFRPYDYNRRGY